MHGHFIWHCSQGCTRIRTMSAEQLAAEAAEAAAAAAGQDGGTELDLTNAHLPSLADVPGLTQQLTVRVGCTFPCAAAMWKPPPLVLPVLASTCVLALLGPAWPTGLHRCLPAVAPSSGFTPNQLLLAPPPQQSLDLTANRLRSLEPCLLALTGLRRLCLRQNLVSQPAEVEALASAPGGCFPC